MANALKSPEEASMGPLKAYGHGLLFLIVPVLGIFGWRAASDLYDMLKRQLFK